MEPTDNDPQTVPVTGPLPAWLAEQLDLEQRRQQVAIIGSARSKA